MSGGFDCGKTVASLQKTPSSHSGPRGDLRSQRLSLWESWHQSVTERVRRRSRRQGSPSAEGELARPQGRD